MRDLFNLLIQLASPEPIFWARHNAPGPWECLAQWNADREEIFLVSSADDKDTDRKGELISWDSSSFKFCSSGRRRAR